VSPGTTVTRSFSARRGQNHPSLLGVYIPSSASLRISPINNYTRPDMSDHPYAMAEPQPSLSRKSTVNSKLSSMYPFAYQESVAGTERAVENALSRQPTRHSHVKTARTTPQVTPSPSIASSVADVGEAPWRNSAWPIGASRKIVPHQVAYANHLEREAAEREREFTMGPVPPPARPLRPRVEIPEGQSSGLLAPGATKQRESLTPNSAAVYGSDIVRLTPSRKGRDKMRHHVSWSPRSPADSAAGSYASFEPSGRRFSTNSSDLLSSGRNGSDESLNTRAFGTPPRARRPTFGSIASADSSTATITPAISSGRVSGPRWRRPSAASVFSQPLSSAGISVTSPGGETVTDAETGNPLPGGLAPAPRLTWIRGPRPPPAAYSPGVARFRSAQAQLPVLGSVREETPTPTRELTE
jgi:hypothetical protein